MAEFDHPLDVDQPKLTIVPVYWREAKEFVARLHRHHLPGGNGRFCIGVEDEGGNLRGVAVLGRTKARMLPHKHVLEATRVATDGCPNACSALYGATCRLHKPHGYRKACTYILISEPGTSLLAAGWRPVASYRPIGGSSCPVPSVTTIDTMVGSAPTGQTSTSTNSAVRIRARAHTPTRATSLRSPPDAFAAGCSAAA
jgi:hypothetical protein